LLLFEKVRRDLTTDLVFAVVAVVVVAGWQRCAVVMTVHGSSTIAVAWYAHGKRSIHQ
jgi:hypothetical protein